MKPSNETVQKELSNRQIKLTSNYENYRTRKVFCCDKSHQWECTAYDIIERQHSCPECGNETPLNNQKIDEQVSNLNKIRKDSNGMRKREMVQRTGDYQGHHVKIGWKCLCCNWEWLSTPHDILFRGVGCPLCHVKNETIVLLALKDRMPQIDIQRQLFLCNYEYDGKTREATCDFYFELKGKKYIVEYNGKQHYELVKFGSTMSDEQAQKKLDKQKFRDEVVRNFCLQNGIELVVIDGRKVQGEKKVQAFIETAFKG